MSRGRRMLLGAFVVAQLMVAPVSAQVAAEGRNLPPPSYGNTGGDVFAATLRCATRGVTGVTMPIAFGSTTSVSPRSATAMPR